MSQTQQLSDLEGELKDLSLRQRKNWQRIVYLLLTIQESEVFRPAHDSFSNWLRHFASEVGLHESTFWRYYAAGSYYLQKTGLPTGDIELAAISPRKLELVKRIEEHNPQVGADLFEAVLNEDPRATVRLLSQTWEKVRDGKTQEEMRVLELRPIAEHLVAEFAQLSEARKDDFVRALLDAIVTRGARDVIDRALVIFSESTAV